MPPMMHTRNSKTSAFGRKAMPAWVRYTGPPTSSFSYTKMDVANTSTTLNSGASEEAERIFGNMLGMSSFGKDRDATLAGHPTPKPLALVSDAILDCSKRGGIILDAFAGSGTTLLAAEKTGRRGYGIELDLHYADLIITRFEEVYGLEAIHINSDLSFDRVRTERTERNKNGQAGTINAKGRKRIGRTLSSKKQQMRKEKRTRRKESVSSIGDYEVGRGKPPKNTQFKKSDGRHRPGRPKGSKNLATLIMEAARDQVSVTIDGKPRKISKAKSAAIQLANKGATGDPKAIGSIP